MIRESFLNSVKNHAMYILRDDGAYRHIVFKKPDSCVNQFSLTTFPGRLVISGDMGAYVFARLPDMFTFFPSFRGRKDFDYEYYAEKCEAQDKHGGIKEYSSDIAQKYVFDYLKEEYSESIANKCVYDRREDLTDEELRRIYVDKAEQFRDVCYATSDAVHSGIHELIPESWEADFNELTPNFKWAIHAICWGIDKYNDFKDGANGKD